MRWDLVAPAVIVASVGAFVLLERIAPYDRQRLLREGFWTDLVGYTLVQSYVLAWLIGRLIAALEEGAGAWRPSVLASWPVAAQVAFFVVTHDLYIYWFHRWQHASPLLWRLHEAHHSVESVDWIAASRSHALEILVNQTVEFAPMVLLGADPRVPLIKGMIGAVWGMWIHANVGVRTGRLQWIVNGPEAHRWHHAVDLDARGHNFATKLALWDRLFGTAWLPEGRKPSGYGLSDVDYPRTYVGQQVFAFRPFRGAPPTDGVAVTEA